MKGLFTAGVERTYDPTCHYAMWSIHIDKNSKSHFFPMMWSITSALRFFFSIIVACCHLTWFLETPSIWLRLSAFDGFTAVVGFLLISGFSIARSLQRDKTGFYLRRMARIYPVYALTIAFGFILPRIFDGTLSAPMRDAIAPTFSSTGLNLFFLQGFIAPYISTVPPVWTLSIEVLFYLFAPLFFTMRNQYLVGIVLASGTAFIATRWLDLPYFSMMQWGLGAALLAWPWLLGFILGMQEQSKFRRYLPYTVAFSFALLMTKSGGGRLWPISLALVFLAFRCEGSFIEKNLHPRIQKISKFLGDLSYPIYLIHMPLFWCLCELNCPSIAAIFIFILLITSAAIHLFFERPVNQLIKKIWFINKVRGK